MSKRKIYFGAGPARLPGEVLQEAAEAVLDYDHSGISILEIPHRGKAFEAIMDESSALVKQLCGLDDDYEVLWLQGGGRLQFTMAPMNFLGDGETAGYMDSGHWAHEALFAAQYYGMVQVLASSADANYTHLPQWPKPVDASLAYVHITTNNTIYGTQYTEVPEIPVPLIGDMSSDIFSMQRDYSKYAMFYAVAQKNMGPAGVTLVVVRRDMLEGVKREIPDVLSYAAQAKAKSLLNTPPVFAIYTSLLNLRWIAAKGIAAIESENRQKADLLYFEVERNPLFHTPVATESRSLMNVIFRGKDEDTERRFLAFCKERDIEGIGGHRSVGGFRASLYNAVTKEDVQVLVEAMKDFV